MVSSPLSTQTPLPSTRTRKRKKRKKEKRKLFFASARTGIASTRTRNFILFYFISFPIRADRSASARTGVASTWTDITSARTEVRVHAADLLSGRFIFSFFTRGCYSASKSRTTQEPSSLSSSVCLITLLGPYCPLL
jgi:hypothetical protein